jgi:hypothetical protein
MVTFYFFKARSLTPLKTEEEKVQIHFPRIPLIRSTLSSDPLQLFILAEPTIRFCQIRSKVGNILMESKNNSIRRRNFKKDGFLISGFGALQTLAIRKKTSGRAVS